MRKSILSSEKRWEWFVAMGIIVLSVICLSANGQAIALCDSVYDHADRLPEYNKGSKGLMDYLSEELMPVVSDCQQRDEAIISSLRIDLIISDRGEVVDVVFIRPALTDTCKVALKQKLLKMEGWSPGIVNGRAVCSKYTYVISCIKWQ